MPLNRTLNPTDIKQAHQMVRFEEACPEFPKDDRETVMELLSRCKPAKVIRWREFCRVWREMKAERKARHAVN